ncbi:MAG: hypothetical protein R3325_07170, partial [Thermoanaerobaculia bacterium]|nr:hypothetical protein [Thermoanaerobaculia bacterium]
MTLRRLPLDLATPLALLLFLFAFARAVDDPASAAELGYLAVLATAVLVPLACLPDRMRWGLETTAVLVAAAAIALPAGDLRGAAIGLLLTACAALELFRLAGCDEPPPWAAVAAAALALQMIFRSGRLLTPELDLRTLVGLLGLPLAGAVATRFLWGSLGRRSATAAGLLLAMAPGWRVAPTLTLGALAAAVALPGSRLLPAAPARSRDAPLDPRLPVGAALAAVVVAASLWRPAFGPLLLLAAAVLRARERPAVELRLAALALGLALLPAAPQGWEGVLPAASLWLLLLPTAALIGPRRWPALAAAAALGLAGHRWLAEPAAAWGPAVGTTALLLVLPPAAERLQRLWTGALLFGGALLACYPWLRAEPLAVALDRVGLAPAPVPAVAVMAGVVAFALALEGLPYRWVHPVRPAAAGAVALFVGALVSLPPPAVAPLGRTAFVLDQASPGRQAAVDPPVTVSEVVADTYLSNAAGLAAGTPVARVRLIGESGASVTWEILAGRDTGEWAARRPDVAALPGLSPPAPWLSWVAAEGFFGQRYRARHRPTET